MQVSSACRRYAAVMAVVLAGAACAGGSGGPASCDAIARAYEAAVPGAQACDPADPNACSTLKLQSLATGTCCGPFVAVESGRSGTLDALAAEYAQGRCPVPSFPIGACACVRPPAWTCQATATGAACAPAP